MNPNLIIPMGLLLKPIDIQYLHTTSQPLTTTHYIKIQAFHRPIYKNSSFFTTHITNFQKVSTFNRFQPQRLENLTQLGI